MDGTDEQPTLREKAYESFTRHLLARDVRPGQFVSQRRLVELTGLTLGAIRELIPRLEAEGLIKTVPRTGFADRSYRSEPHSRGVPAARLPGEGSRRAFHPLCV